MIDSNCSISVITNTWLTIGDSALASQLTPDGFKVLMDNKYIFIYSYIYIYIYIYIYTHHIVVVAKLCYSHRNPS